MDDEKQGSITSELRKLIVSAPNSKSWKDKFFRIADHIDTEHEAQIKREETMAEHGWVRGPIGADGKLMAKGDKAVDDKGNIGVIVETRFNDDNWFVLFDFGEGHSARFVWFLPKSLTHYHAPTVKDVLRNFGADIAHALDADPDGAIPEDIIAKYAAKLCLTDDEEE